MGDEPTSSQCLTCSVTQTTECSIRNGSLCGRDATLDLAFLVLHEVRFVKPLDIVLAITCSLQIIFFRNVIDLIEFAVPHRQPYSVLYHVS